MQSSGEVCESSASAREGNAERHGAVWSEGREGGEGFAVNETLCCAAGHASLGREFRIDPIPTIRSRLPFDSARFDVREIRPIE